MTPVELSDYWNDDFTPLQAAAEQINAALREDEQNADLYRRISSGNGTSSHLYFPCAAGAGAGGAAADSHSSNNVPPLQKLQHSKSVPLPPLIQEKLNGVKMQSLMGLMAPADLAWIAVDEQLYLWSYAARTGFRSPSSGGGGAAGANASQFCSFTVPTGECIVSVGLVRPKQGTGQAPTKTDPNIHCFFSSSIVPCPHSFRGTYDCIFQAYSWIMSNGVSW